MPRGVTEKTLNNKYYQARARAGRNNKPLRNRVYAAHALPVSKESLSDYEGSVRLPPPAVVARMSGLYNAPELLNDYCITCPIGEIIGIALELKPIERLALQLIKNTNNMDDMRDMLADITADGVIDDQEKPKLQQIISFFENLEKSIGEIILWCRKEGLIWD